LDLALTVLGIVAPVLLLGVAGFTWARAGYDYPIAFVTRMSMTLAVPCLIFTALMDAEIAPAALTALSVAALAAYGVVLALSWGLVALTGLDRRAHVAPLAFGNTGNIGLPLALFAYGEAGLSLAVVVFAVMALFTFTVGLWLVAGAAAPARVLREPMLWATVLGGLFLSMGWQTPDWLTRSLTLVGQMAIPLMLITLGVAIARLRPGRLGRAVWLSAAKLALGLAAGVVAGRWFALEPTAFGVLVLQMATPVAVTSYLLAERYDADPDAVAGLVMVSTLMAVAAMPVTLSFLL
jgi:predicted permease